MNVHFFEKNKFWVGIAAFVLGPIGIVCFLFDSRLRAMPYVKYPVLAWLAVVILSFIPGTHNFPVLVFGDYYSPTWSYSIFLWTLWGLFFGACIGCVVAWKKFRLGNKFVIIPLVIVGFLVIIPQGLRISGGLFAGEQPSYSTRPIALSAPAQQNTQPPKKRKTNKKTNSAKHTETLSKENSGSGELVVTENTDPSTSTSGMPEGETEKSGNVQTQAEAIPETINQVLYSAGECTIGEYPVRMDLTLYGQYPCRSTGEKARGTYYYESQGSANKLRLEGYKCGNRLVLDEYNATGKKTGTFEGFLKNGSYKGTWMSSGMSKDQNFKIMLQ